MRWSISPATRTVQVTKEELLNAVWTDVSVTEDSLVHSISALRRAIGDDSTNPKLIVTIPRRGYRLTGPVQAASDPPNDVRLPAGVLATPDSVGRSAIDPLRGHTPWGPPTRWTAVAIATAAALVVVVRSFVAPSALPRSATVLLSQPAPQGATLASGGILSPDSRYMVFAAQDQKAPRAPLYLKQMDSGDLRLLGGTEGASHPFWSPTSDIVGFFANGALKTVNLHGDAPAVIATVPVSAGGGTWGKNNGPILFSDWQTGLYRVAPSGGPVTRVTTVNRSAGERVHNLPQFLPDGRHFLFFVLSSNADQTGTYVGSLDSSESTRLLGQSSSAAVYAPPGLLLYVQNEILMERSFDVSRLELTGVPLAVARNVAAPNDADGQMISASTSLLTFRSGPKALELAWFDREGRRTGNIPGGKALRSPMFSQDQKQLAAMGSGPSLWVVDLERDSAARSEGEGLYPLWSPDSNRIAFESPNSLTLFVRNLRRGVGTGDLARRRTQDLERLVRHGRLPRLRDAQSPHQVRPIHPADVWRPEGHTAAAHAVQRNAGTDCSKRADDRVRLGRIGDTGSLRAGLPLARPQAHRFDWWWHGTDVAARRKRALIPFTRLRAGVGRLRTGRRSAHRPAQAALSSSGQYVKHPQSLHGDAGRREVPDQRRRSNQLPLTDHGDGQRRSAPLLVDGRSPAWSRDPGCR